MSFAEQMSAAVADIKSYAEAENLSRTLWKGHYAGLLGDDDAHRLSEAIEAQKRLLAGRTYPIARKRSSGLPRRPEPRSPDRQKSIARRRSLAASGAVPCTIATDYSTGENAVLTVIGREVQRRGSCDLPVGEIAARAGVCPRLVRLTIRAAAAALHIHIQERPRKRMKSLTNVITIVSAEWRQWLKLGGNRVKKSAGHENHVLKSSPRRLAHYVTDRRSATITPEDYIWTQQQRHGSFNGGD